MERVHPETSPRPIVEEHLARYRAVCGYPLGKHLLDIAAGTAYGSQLIARSQELSVVAVDRAAEALGAGRADFGHPRVRYVKARAESLPFRDAAFDSVVCFETLEHVERSTELLAEIARVLEHQGRLFISTPNRKLASPWWPITHRPSNPHHHFEYTSDELERQLTEWFDIRERWGQRYVRRTWVHLPVYALVRGVSRLAGLGWADRLYDEASGPALYAREHGLGEPRYFVLLCSRRGRT